MSTQLVVQEGNWTPAQMKLITDVVARGATPDELKLFMYRCEKMGLDPLKSGQVHFVKYGSGPGSIIVGIEGFRSIAARTGKVSGISRGVIKENGQLVGAWCEVHRSDWKNPAREEVPFAEYNTGKGPWAKMPETMLKKVAEAAALRMAFPDDLGGVYTKEEMDQAEPEKMKIHGEQPPETDGLTPDRFIIEFGKWNRKTLEQVYRDEGPNAIADYIQYIEDSAKKKGVEPSGKALVFIQEAERFLGVMENMETAES